MVGGLVYCLLFLHKQTGLAISNAIKESLCTYNIDISKAQGQAHDGASAMSSYISGAKACIREVDLYTHCWSHVLNLSISATCQVPEVRNIVDTINSCFLYFNNSPEANIFWISFGNHGCKKKHLVGLCKTRWAEQHTYFETILELYKYLSVCLKAIISLLHLPELVLVTPDDSESENGVGKRTRKLK